jgi:N-succinyldiaminopimelate aminotransferase
MRVRRKDFPGTVFDVMGKGLEPAQRVAGFGTTVFSEFSALALKSGAVNLGQGFPDFDGPEQLKEIAIRAIRDGHNQYAVGSGSKVLKEAISTHAERFYGQKIDPETMVTVTSGATEALFDTIQAFVNQGDEVILFEPFYDSYAASVTMAGGTCKGVLLRAPDKSHHTWWFAPEALRSAFTARTRMLVLNTPHNPTGKVYSREELRLIADLCIEHDVLVLSDEVYEHLVFAPAQHLRIATLDGMAERTVTVSSAGKTFSVTGWKVGWAIGAPRLRDAVQAAHQFVTFATNAPFQQAMAQALAFPDIYFQGLISDYQRRRDFWVDALRKAGFVAHSPEGTYFTMAELTGLGFQDDVAFCRHLTQDAKVAAIPPSVFYLPEHASEGRRFARFAFCKTDPVLAEAQRRLEHWSLARR